MSDIQPLPPTLLLVSVIAALWFGIWSSDAHSQARAQPLNTSKQVFKETIIAHHYTNNPDVNALIDEMVARYGFDPTALHTLFDRVNYSRTSIKLSSPPAKPELKNWRAYQARFVSPLQINAGVRFWHDNQAALQRAYRIYGVSPEIIVAIIGVETMYGRYMGNFRVIDVLTTLAFDYPPTPNRADRQSMFRQNLVDFLVWTRSVGIDPMSVKGSYAGAIGLAQFMPSSIVRYAVSAERGRRVDLQGNPADAIVSIANFLKQHGWQTGRPVVWSISPDSGSQGIAQAATDNNTEPHWKLAQLLKAGMLLNAPDINIAAELGTPVAVIDLPTPSQPTQYILGLENFHVLTCYNRSSFYALAVYELSQQLRSWRQ